jgi:hypothetical protein
MKTAELIKRAIEQNGLFVQRLNETAKSLGISVELLRIVINKGHVPKDKTLKKIADKLGMNAPALILAAHQERVPIEVKGYFLSAVQEQPWRKKRVFPLSEEQCNYLRKIMSQDEIQILRKFRQVPEEAQTQVLGYVDYAFASKRTAEARGAVEMAPLAGSLKLEGRRTK